MTMQVEIFYFSEISNDSFFHSGLNSIKVNTIFPAYLKRRGVK